MSAVSKIGNPEKFRILALPYVALKEVLSTWSPFDLINFSLINQTTRIITKSIKKPKSHRLESSISMCPYLTLSIYGSNIKYDFELTNDERQRNHRINVDDRGDVTKTMQTFFENGLSGFFDWCDFVLDVLNLRIEQVSFGNFQKKNFEIQKFVIEWISTHTKCVKWFRSSGNSEPADELISYFLNRIDVTKVVDLNVPLTENFSLKSFPKPSERLAVHSGKWIRMEQILENGSPGIHIKESAFSNQELKLFVKKWMMAETNLNLRCFSVGVQNDFNEMFDELKKEAMSPEMVVLNEENDIELKRIDGKRATVTTEPRREGFSLNMAVEFKSAS